MGISEIGSNYPKELFNPNLADDSDLYDNLGISIFKSKVDSLQLKFKMRIMIKHQKRNHKKQLVLPPLLQTTALITVLVFYKNVTYTHF